MWPFKKQTEAVEVENDPRSDEQITKHRAIVQMVRDRQDEYRQYVGDSRPGLSSLVDEWNDCGHRFVGNYEEGGSIRADGMQEGYRIYLNREGDGGPRRLYRAKLMRTQNSVVANVAANSQQPVRGMLEPMETSMGEVCYLSARGGMVVKRYMEAKEVQLQAMVATGAAEMDPEAPDADLAARAIDDEADQALVDIKDALGNPDDAQLVGDDGPTVPLTREQAMQIRNHPDIGGLLADDDFVWVSDSFVARKWQRVLDVKWDQSNTDMHLMMHMLMMSVFGQLSARVEWDAKMRTVRICNKSMRDVATDVTQYDLARAEFFIEEYLLSPEAATAKWPEYGAHFHAAAAAGMQGTANWVGGGMTDNVNFRRKMVKITVAWMRHQPVPMDEDEAVRQGLVERDEKSPGVYYLAEEDGEGSKVIVEPAIDTDHGTEWPTDPDGLRQVVILDKTELVLEDQRCPYADIPAIWSINIPRPDLSPFGQGEPVRLRDIDAMIQRALSVIASYMGYEQFPAYFWPASVLAEMRKQNFSMHVRPGVIHPVPDEDYYKIMQAGGFERTRHQPAPIPPAFVNVLNFLLKEHDTLSGNTDVRQGRAPYSGASGKTVETLASQAVGPLAFKAKFFEYSVRRLVTLFNDALVKWLPEADVKEILDSLPLPVVKEVMRRVGSMRFDVKVELATGSGSTRQANEQMAMAKHQAGLQSTRSTMEAMGVEDPDKEMEEIMQERGAVATTAPSVQAAAVDNREAV